VWFHGDVAAGNLLVRGGRLAAVIDFGSSGVGDPACDVAIAWTFLEGEARDRFRAERDVDAATWSRGRGWTLWKSLITMVGALVEDDDEAVAARRREIDVISADFAAER
jgi:aminoglycoside phosphotransferase (APT) family kinase protein